MKNYITLFDCLQGHPYRWFKSVLVFKYTFVHRFKTNSMENNLKPRIKKLQGTAQYGCTQR